MSENRDVNERVRRLEEVVKKLQERVAAVDTLLKEMAEEPRAQGRPAEPEAPPAAQKKKVVLKWYCAQYVDRRGREKEKVIYAASLDSVRRQIEKSGGQFKSGRETSKEAISGARKPIKSEDVLNKVGIALLLLGLAFFFKYAVDQGWLTPAIRIAFGFVLGTFLLALGLRMEKKHPKFATVLQGGSVGTYYVTIFAAFQLYEFMSYPTAFVFMVAVTVLTFVLSVQQSNPVLSIIGTIGGLGTPFVLYTGSQNLPGLIVYTSLILVGASLVYYCRGWRALVFVSGLGTWLVLFIGYFDSIEGRQAALSDQIALQSGIVFAWLVLGGLSIVHEVLLKDRPRKWNVTPYTRFEDLFFRNSEHALASATAFVPLILSMRVWILSEMTWGWITVGVSLVYGALAVVLKKKKLNLSYTHAILALLLLTAGFVQIFEGRTLLFVLAAEATVIHLVGHKLSDRILTGLAHVLFIVAAGWLANRLWYEEASGTVLLNIQAVTDLAVIVMGMGVATVLTSKPAAKVYLIVGHIAVLSWFYREYAPLTHGEALTTVSWGLYALALIIAGFFARNKYLRTAGIVIVFVVVGKLFLVDMSSVTPIWRVLLFMGFGGILLVLSYYLPKLMNGKKEKEGDSLH